MKGKNLIWGLFFILAGAAVILSKLGLLGGVSALSVVISLLLIPIIVNSIRRLNFWGIFCPLAVMAEYISLFELLRGDVIGSARKARIYLHIFAVV